MRKYFIFILIFGTINVLLLGILAGQNRYGQFLVESRLISAKEEVEKEQTIRVVIKTNDHKNIVHEEVKLGSDAGLILSAGEKTMEIENGVTIRPDDELFSEGTISVTGKNASKIAIESIERTCGTPAYRGRLELFSTAEGIVVVNELLLEEYLYSVVPSEMPASYEFEALKTQAICARSYAYGQMKNQGYPEYHAHVDDSVSFQVYGNCEESISSTKAVKETEGEMLWYGGKVARTYFYSTSAGHSTSIEAWEKDLEESNAYLQGVKLCDAEGNSFEKDLPWFRWKIRVSAKKLEETMELNAGKEIGELTEIRIAEKGTGDVVQKLEVLGTDGKITLKNENKIRKILGNESYKVVRQDGTEVTGMNMLPSAFFTIEKADGSYIIKGGGYGHGIGMSQNGANEMAKQGMAYREILNFFYPGTKVK